MDFTYSDKVQKLQTRVTAFMQQYVYPNEDTFYQEVAEGDRWQPTRIVEELKKTARKDRWEYRVVRYWKQPAACGCLSAIKKTKPMPMVFAMPPDFATW